MDFQPDTEVTEEIEALELKLAILEDKARGSRGVRAQLRHNVGALVIRIGFGGIILCFYYNKEPPQTLF